MAKAARTPRAETRIAREQPGPLRTTRHSRTRTAAAAAEPPPSRPPPPPAAPPAPPQPAAEAQAAPATLKQLLQGLTFMQARAAAMGQKIRYKGDDYEIEDMTTSEMPTDKVMTAWTFDTKLLHTEKGKAIPRNPNMSGELMLRSQLL
jgi:hypothetical protein